jgi:hypothetical protein
MSSSSGRTLTADLPPGSKVFDAIHFLSSALASPGSSLSTKMEGRTFSGEQRISLDFV